MTKSIPLTQGKFAIIDDDDYERISKHKWTFANAGYAYRKSPRPNPKALLMHRVVIRAKTGQEVDHINGDRLDNRKENLRFCTSSQNKANMKLRKDNTSGYKGVSLDKRDNVFQAYINVSGKRFSLGRHETAIEAAKVYNEAAKKYFGEYSRLNKV